MGKSSKTRKKHRSRMLRIPMQTSTRDNLALELRLAIEVLILAPSPATYNQCSSMLAALMRSGVEGDAIDAATGTLTLICDRYERVGKVGVSEDEAASLRGATGGLDSAIGRIPLNKFREAVATVTAHMADMGAV